MFSKQNYKKSNSITEIDFQPSNKAIKTASFLLLIKPTPEARQLHCQLLVNALSADRKLDSVTVKISAAKQYHKKTNGRVTFKQYGYYKPQNKYIYITNFTAVRGQPLAAKTFLDTLLHEWLHHFDYQALGLNSIHTAGFYARLKHLKGMLRID